MYIPGSGNQTYLSCLYAAANHLCVCGYARRFFIKYKSLLGLLLFYLCTYSTYKNIILAVFALTIVSKYLSTESELERKCAIFSGIISAGT